MYKVPVVIKSENEVVKIAPKVGQGKVCPIFTISSTTGEGIDNLKSFLREIPKPPQKNLVSEETKESDAVTTQVVIDNNWQTKAFGLILGGVVVKGTVKVNQEMMFGPDRNGNFKAVVIKEIQENRV